MKPGTFNVVSGLKGDLRLRLKETLRRMQTRFGVSGLKLSTEDAGMSLEQIRYWSALCKGIVPVIVKIGGPNARNDIRQLLKMKIAGLIAPMVESEYGLINFIEAVQDYTNPMQFEAVEKHINIETVVALRQLSSILKSSAIKHIDEITIGRKDLSRSLNIAVDDPGLIHRVQKVVSRIKKQGIKISVGGGITPETIDDQIRDICPDKFNTRLVTFDVNTGQSYRSAVREALQFEIMSLKNDAAQGFISMEEEKFRIKELNKRLG